MEIGFEQGKSMSDIVWVELISSLAWLVFIAIIIISFRKEIRSLLTSIASLKVAGSSFEFKDKKAEYQSYVDLSEVFIAILSERNATFSQVKLITRFNAQKLMRFGKRYLAEVPKTERNYELLKNIAYILSRHEFYGESIEIYDNILEDLPENPDAMNLKAMILENRKMGNDIIEAERYANILIEKYPTSSQYHQNRSIIKADLKKYDEALSDIEKAMEFNPSLTLSDILSDQSFYLMKKERFEEITRIAAKFKDRS